MSNRASLEENENGNDISDDAEKKRHIAAGVAAGSLAAAGAAPLAAIGVVQSLGFASGGIVAGSTAAAMMSAQAIAAGGGIASGGTVATLQSIGAIGFASGLPSRVSHSHR